MMKPNVEVFLHVMKQEGISFSFFFLIFCPLLAEEIEQTLQTKANFHTEASDQTFSDLKKRIERSNTVTNCKCWTTEEVSKSKQ